ncbi:nucleotidyltransferase domain-containing protein [Fervidicoccus sp.]|uniref:nucleotidyltransferase domain-containing protein n=1 Tax=Fervidicoccus sp. TaxID=2060324 RepID=UPI003D1308D8
MFIDHDLIIDKYGTIYQVMGYYHPIGIIYAFKKYKLSAFPSIWGSEPNFYMRIFREYSPKIAHKGFKTIYDPNLKTFLPYVNFIDIKFHIDPGKSIERLLRKTRDSLEKTALELILKLEENGIKLDSIGIGGSIALGIHNPNVSDIDVIIYDSKSLKVIEQSNIIEPYKNNELENWFIKNSVRLSVPVKYIYDSYEPKRRGKYKGYDVSLIPVNRNMPEGIFKVDGKYAGIFDFIAESAKISELSYFYPHVVDLTIKKVIKGSKSIEGKNCKLIVYESLFFNILKKFNLFKIRAKTYISKKENITAIVGIREAHTYIYKLK